MTTPTTEPTKTTQTAGAPVVRIPVGMEVTFVGMTLPHSGDRGAKPPSVGRKLAAPLASAAGRPIVLAYCWVKIEDARGHGFVVSDLRLMSNGREMFLNFPSEVRKLACRNCGGRNVPRAKFCNWCGLAVEGGAVDYHDLFRPSNDRTAAMILSAVQLEYAEKMRDVAAVETA